MGKKSKRGNIPINYEEIEDNLQRGNYRLVATILRKTKFPPKEKKRGDQLNIDTHFYWALDLFNQKEYTQAISTLRMFVERYKNKITLPLEKSDMLLGLSYLYLNNWEKATMYLQKANSNPNTKAFNFYYLLALIYQKKYQDFDSLLAAHQPKVDALAVPRQQYLAIAYALVAQDFEQAATLLETYPKEELDEETAANITALQAIVTGTTYQTEEKPLNSLYKFLLAIPLSVEEKNYIEAIPQLEASAQEVKKGQLKETVKEALHELCVEGASLSREDFEACMELPEEYRPYIVYNQIAALFNEDIEYTEEEVLELLRKYEWYFFRVPESIFLFSQIVYWDEENFTPTTFWRAMETSFDRFGKTFTPLQLNRLSWRVMSCLEFGDLGVEKAHIKQQTKLIKSYPQLVGLKFGQLLDYMIAPKLRLPEASLDLFTFAGFNYGSEIAKDKLAYSLNDMRGFEHKAKASFDFDFDFMMDPVAKHGFDQQIDKIYREIIENTLTVFIKATTEHEIHLKNRVVLDLFKIAHEFIQKFHAERFVDIDADKQTAFATAYHQALVLFEEDTSDSEHFQYYQSQFAHVE